MIDYVCVRGINAMGKKRNKKKTDTISDKRNNWFKENFNKIIIAVSSAIISTIIISILSFVYSLPNNVREMNTTIRNFSESLTKYETRLRNVENKLSALTREPLISEREQKPVEQQYKVYPLTIAGSRSMPIVMSVENVNTNVGLSCNDETIIAEDRETGEEKKAKNLIGKNILLPYKENGQEIFFLGQYNKKYHWEGNCTINVYKNNKLILITEAVYEDGNLVSYKQVLEDKIKSGNVWIVSNRVRKGKVNEGTSSSFYKRKDVNKKFTMKNVIASSIVTVKKFKKNLKTKQEGFYYGNTKNGKFNDQTGKAYMVKYNKKGKIRLFYCGRFKNGQPEDHTGKAWDIVLGKDGKYVYRKAEYANGKINYKTIKDKDMKVTKKEIKKLLNGIDIKCKLSWDFSKY